MVMAAVPIIEVKGAIPVAVAFDMSLWEAYVLAVAGAFLPSPLIMLFFRPIAGFLRGRIGFMRRFLDWVESRADRKGAIVRKYSLLGLFVFVAVPLPGTGVWMGSLIACLLNLRMKHALPVVFLGDIVSALVILLVSYVFVG